MSLLGILLGIVLVVAVVTLSILRRTHATKVEQELNQIRVRAEGRGHKQEDIDDAIDKERANRAWPVPDAVRPALIALSLAAFGMGMFHNIFFYAQPGFIYHVTTIGGEERVIGLKGSADVGYSYHLFGTINSWKKGMSVQASLRTGSIDDVDAEGESSNMSASMKALNVTFLDQVDANVEAMARFELPMDREAFLKIVHKYRSPSNLLRTALIPAFKETLNANASLMSAETYFSGGRNEFQNGFESQMTDGIYMVVREEVVEKVVKAHKASSNASKGTEQEDFGEEEKVVFKVNKILDENGLPKRKAQKFNTNFGIVVADARVMNLIPNDKFKSRMDQKQEASAKRAIAREQRLQEEDQKELAITKGQREQAERQATWLADQIEQTTKAETKKQLALTEAEKLKEQAEIQEQTAAIILRRDEIKAQSVKVLADAEAHKKKVLLEADNALKIKVDALVQMNSDAMNAMAKRNVPATVIYSGGAEGGLGSDNDINNIATTQLLKNIKALDLNMGVKK